MKLAMIVPNLPPAVCGVYDYTRKLHEHWHDGGPWTLLCPRRGQAWPGATTVRIERSGESLAQALSEVAPTHIALQYTCYGYADNGVPTWLADGLEEFKRARSARLCVMFHELFYNGPPWKRAYWRKSRQLALAQRLCNLAQSVLCGVPAWLGRLFNCSGGRANLAPIASNIEPVETCRHEGKLTVGVFGLPPTRLKALREGRRLLEALAFQDSDFEVHVLGAKAGSATTEEKKALKCIGVRRIVRVENPDEQGLSRALARCHIMLAAETGPQLHKSGSVMAALAHGCALFVGGEGDCEIPALRFESARADELVRSLKDKLARKTGESGKLWYEAHSGWPRAAAVWQAALQ